MFHRVTLWLRCCLAGVVLLCAVGLNSAEAHYGDFYNQWKDTDVATLLEHGRKCDMAHDDERALMFYRLITNKMEKNASPDVQKIYANAFINMGAIFQNMNDNQHAYESFMRAMEIVEKYDFEGMVPYIYTDIGSIYQDMHEYNTAMDYHRRALDKALSNRDWYITEVAAENIFTHAIVNDDIKRYGDVLTHIEQHNIDTSNPCGKFVARYTRAMRLLQQDSVTSAITAMDHAIACVSDSMFERPELIMFDLYHCKSLMLERMGQREAAITTLHRCEQMGEQHDIGSIKMTEVSKLMSELYMKNGQTDSAYVYWNKVYRINDTAGDSQERASRIRSMQSLYDLNKKNEEITQANARNRMQSIVLTVIGLFSLVVLGLLLYLYRQKKALAQQHQELFRRNAEVIQREEVERKQLQRYQEQLSQQHGELQQLRQQQMKSAADYKFVVANEPVKYADSPLDESSKLDMLNQIQQVMESNDEIFSPEFTISRLAELIGVKSRWISQVINEFYQKNFNAYLSEIRIHEACKRLTDDEERGQYTIEAISSAVGFKSRSGFFVAFKKVTGLSPTEYIRAASRSRDGV